MRQNVSTIPLVTFSPAGAPADPLLPDGAFALAFDWAEAPDVDPDKPTDSVSGFPASSVLQIPVWPGLGTVPVPQVGIDGRTDAGPAPYDADLAEPGMTAPAGTLQNLTSDPATDAVPLALPMDGGDAAGGGTAVRQTSLQPGNRTTDKSAGSIGDLPKPTTAVFDDKIQWPGRGAEGGTSAATDPHPIPNIPTAASDLKAPVSDTDGSGRGRIQFPGQPQAQTGDEGSVKATDRLLTDSPRQWQAATPAGVETAQVVLEGDTPDTSSSVKAANAALSYSDGLAPIPSLSRDMAGTAPFPTLSLPVEAPVATDQQPTKPSTHLRGDAGKGSIRSDVSPGFPVPDGASALRAAISSPDPGADADADADVTNISTKSAGTVSFRHTPALIPDAMPRSAPADAHPAFESTGQGAILAEPDSTEGRTKGLTPGVWERLFTGVMTASPVTPDKATFLTPPMIVTPDPTAPTVDVGLRGADGSVSPAPDDPVGSATDPVRTLAAGSIATLLPHRDAENATQAVDPAIKPGDGFASLDDSALPFLTAVGPSLPGAAPSVGLPQAPTTVHMPQVAGQIAAALAQNSDGSTDLALSPEELGKVRLKLKPDAGNPDRMIVMITFERPETLELFRRNVGELADALRSAGYAGADIGFGREGGSAAESDRRERSSGRAGGQLPVEPSDISPPPARLVAGASLDLRL